MADLDEGEQSLTDLAAGLLVDSNKEVGTKDAVVEGADAQPDADEGRDEEPSTPEGTGEPAEAEESGDEPEGEEGQDEPSAEPFYTVKVDGKDVRVTLKEALLGYQRNEDYTRKTQEVAEARKATETELGAARQARDQYAAVLRLVQERLGNADQEPTAEQWNTLRQSDPAAYATAYADFQRRQDQRKAVAVEQQRVADENRLENLRRAQTFLESERTKLHTALPVLADKEKGPVELRAIRDYAAKTFGYTEQEMDQAYDHRMVVAMDKARRWDAHVATLAKAKQKVSEAPALPAPGSRVPVKSRTAARRAELQKQFDKTGSPEDAAALLLAQ
jgi:hypothetical protein